MASTPATESHLYPTNRVQISGRNEYEMNFGYPLFMGTREIRIELWKTDTARLSGDSPGASSVTGIDPDAFETAGGAITRYAPPIRTANRWSSPVRSAVRNQQCNPRDADGEAVLTMGN